MEKISVKYAGAAAMYFVSKKLKKKYNITDERAALYEAAETWVDALNGRQFLGMYSSSVLNTIIYARACFHIALACTFETKAWDNLKCFDIFILLYVALSLSPGKAVIDKLWIFRSFASQNIGHKVSICIT
jgi:hypothetical protein